MGKKIVSQYPKSFETFRTIGDFSIIQLTQDEPSCFNGEIRVRKYKITIEEINEPTEVIGQRLQNLWDKCDNHHHHQPLKKAAENLGYELKGRFGDKR